MRRDEDDYLPRDDVAEETEGEGDEARDFGKQLDDSHDESYERMEIQELRAVFEKSEHGDACDLGNDEGNGGERQRYVEIGVDTAEKGRELSMREETDTADAGNEFQPVRDEDEKKDGEDEGEKFARHVPPSERVRDVVVDAAYHPLEKRLEAARDELQPATH